MPASEKASPGRAQPQWLFPGLALVLAVAVVVIPSLIILGQGSGKPGAGSPARGTGSGSLITPKPTLAYGALGGTVEATSVRLPAPFSVDVSQPSPVVNPSPAAAAAPPATSVAVLGLTARLVSISLGTSVQVAFAGHILAPSIQQCQQYRRQAAASQTPGVTLRPGGSLCVAVRGDESSLLVLTVRSASGSTIGIGLANWRAGTS